MRLRSVGIPQFPEFVALAQYIEKHDKMLTDFEICGFSGGHRASLL
jgi:hypothetical protein